MSAGRYISLFIIAVFLASWDSHAQDIREILSRIETQTESACMTLTYRFSAALDNVTVADEGFVEVQGNMWHMKGKALEIYTDASSTWVIDHKSKEVIVEPAWSFDDLENFYESVMESGSGTELEVLSEELSEKREISYFTPSFESDWIITDIR